MKICVIGQGYIGLPTAILFSQNGCEVVGVDINEKVVSSLNKGILTIEEEGLGESLKNTINSGHYVAKSHPEEADAYIITVPTPYIKDSFECDLSYVVSACNSIVPYLKKGNVVIVESTIAPLSMKNVIKPLFEKEGYEIGSDLYLAHCPERVLPGNLVYELINNNRIVGGITKECASNAADVYKIFVKGNVIETSAEVAEMSKCMENTFRDVNIALANELVKVSNKLGVDALEVIEIANQHPRVNLHQPGPGVGGHCLAIDPYFIYALAPQEARLIKLSRDINSSMPSFVAEKTNKIFEKYNDKSNNIISIFGLSYKGNSDDDRESPSYEIISLLEKDYEIRIYDPHIPEKSLSFEDAINDSSLILILTDHNEFKNMDYKKILESMKNPVIFDTKNILDKKEIDADVSLYNYGNIFSVEN